MERIVTCPSCGYQFRVSKEIFEKYREGISLKGREVTQGEAVLLDCLGCRRLLRISIRNWHVSLDGPAEHQQGYEWMGADAARRPEVSKESEATTAASLPLLPVNRRIHLNEYGRVERPFPDAGPGTIVAFFFACFLPALISLVEPFVIGAAADPAYDIPVPPPLDMAASDEEQIAVDEPALVAPVPDQKGINTGGTFEKMLREQKKKLESIGERPGR